MLYVKNQAELLSRWIPWLRDFFLLIGATGVVSLFAKVVLPLPFTPIPLVLQDLILVSFGILFGAKRGMCIGIVLLLEGALGLPVFAGGGCGLTYCAGATCGYLIGYPIAAYVSGAIFERFYRSSRSILAGLIAGNLVILSCGFLGLACWIGWSKAFMLGSLPFIPGNILKTIVAFSLLKRWRR